VASPDFARLHQAAAQRPPHASLALSLRKLAAGMVEYADDGQQAKGGNKENCHGMVHK
jgi:hypothetical protein